MCRGGHRLMALQEGIYHAPGRRPGRHLALMFVRAADGADAATVAAALADLWDMYGGLRAGRMRDLDGVALPAEEDQTTVLLGFGRNALRCRARCSPARAASATS